MEPAEITHRNSKKQFEWRANPPTNPIKVKAWLTDNFCIFHLFPPFI
jgi:hypothetical protein